ncbi:MAG: hypothetical protein Q9187_002975, partial [Circinaria calcarea]
ILHAGQNKAVGEVCDTPIKSLVRELVLALSAGIASDGVKSASHTLAPRLASCSSQLLLRIRLNSNAPTIRNCNRHRVETSLASRAAHSRGMMHQPPFGSDWLASQKSGESIVF